VSVVPANEASWDDVTAIFGTADAGRCQRQRFKVVGWIWRDSTQEQRTAMLRTQTACGNPAATTTSGLVAYVDGGPAGWVAVEPRTAYPKLRTTRIPWSGRDEDKDDDSVWAVTVSRSARVTGAAAGKVITWGELHVGARQVFEDAGFREVTHPTPRVVMRIELRPRPRRSR